MIRTDRTDSSTRRWQTVNRRLLNRRPSAINRFRRDGEHVPRVSSYAREAFYVLTFILRTSAAFGTAIYTVPPARPHILLLPRTVASFNPKRVRDPLTQTGNLSRPFDRRRCRMLFANKIVRPICFNRRSLLLPFLIRAFAVTESRYGLYHVPTVPINRVGSKNRARFRFSSCFGNA